MKNSQKTFFILLLIIALVWVLIYQYQEHKPTESAVVRQATDTKDPSKCEVLPVSKSWIGGAGFPREACYLTSITSIGDISMCGKYFNFNSNPSGFNECQLEVSIKKQDASLCGTNNYCVAQVAISSKDVSMCNFVGVDKISYPMWPRSRCVKEVNWAIKLNK